MKTKDRMKKVSISDVAREAGVSVGTVSAVINGKSSVKPSTREKVTDAIRALNFRPQGRAQNLKLNNDRRSIGLIIKQLDNPFYTEVAEGVKEYAKSHGYTLFITTSENDHEQEEQITNLFTTKDINGAIIAPVLDGDAEIDHLFRLKLLNFPFVLLEEVPGIRANVVSIDNTQVTKDLVQYLIQSGHNHIIHFAGPLNAPHALERIDGFKLAFSESHLVFDESLIVPAGGRFQHGFNTGLEYFKNKTDVDFPLSVVCFNDQIALGLISALRKLKIKVPEQVSIVGYDNIELGEFGVVPLTTISPPKRELGQKAAEILIENIESDQILPIRNITLSAEITVRESTQALKTG